ncbi:MAG: hypothetical protein ABS46_14940 [Cytophagaceae bacterium SCN 52-12]|nr:MAG: hypothetical protein ABS46_14940 [Cytophagaceae bacterium SCN 52-12]
MPDFDYLIVGQGIAGTSLAWHMHAAGHRFLIIDNPGLPSSSHVAAGIFNPLTGRKLVKTWLADQLFPYAVDFYRRVEKILGISCLHYTDIFRPYRSAEEKDNYLRWAAENGYEAYISGRLPDFTANRFIRAPFNGLSITRSGWLDLPHFLDSSRNYFLATGCFREADFSSEDLALDDQHAVWQNMRFKKVISCMGAGAGKDAFFNWLPFNPVKGQILDCRVEGYDVEEIVNQGIFILPLGGGLVRIGATYSWHDLDWENTEDARLYLSEKASGLLKAPFSITGQRAGIRPSSADRRPFAGRHPEYSRLYIFNGLGTKGVTLAPFFAQQLVNLIAYGQELHPEVNIERYFSLYSKPGFS